MDGETGDSKSRSGELVQKRRRNEEVFDRTGEETAACIQLLFGGKTGHRFQNKLSEKWDYGSWLTAATDLTLRSRLCPSQQNHNPKLPCFHTPPFHGTPDSSLIHAHHTPSVQGTPEVITLARLVSGVETTLPGKPKSNPADIDRGAWAWPLMLPPLPCPSLAWLYNQTLPPRTPSVARSGVLNVVMCPTHNL